MLPQHVILQDLFTWKNSRCSYNCGTYCICWLSTNTKLSRLIGFTCLPHTSAYWILVRHWGICARTLGYLCQDLKLIWVLRASMSLFFQMYFYFEIIGLGRCSNAGLLLPVLVLGWHDHLIIFQQLQKQLSQVRFLYVQILYSYGYEILIFLERLALVCL